MKIKIEDTRICFPRLFEAEQYQGQGAFNYSAKFLIVPGSENDKKIRQAVEAIAKEKWPKKWERMLEEFRPDKKAYPYIDGSRVEFDGAEGNWVLKAKRKQEQGRPAVLDRNPKINLLPSDGKPYAGCYVHAAIEFWAQDGNTKGIRCTLRGVQFYRDGDSFGGGKPAGEDEFDGLSEGIEAADLV